MSGLAACAASTLILCAAPASALTPDGPAANASKGLSTATWTPDNGDGTFTNPLFYDEFSDPDLIRVGDQTGAIGRRAVAVEKMHFNSDGTIQPVRQTTRGVSILPRN